MVLPCVSGQACLMWTMPTRPRGYSLTRCLLNEFKMVIFSMYGGETGPESSI